MKFTSFNLKQETQATLQRLNFSNLSQIQEATLALSLKGESIIAKAPTGSGKTHSFLLPIINRLDSSINGTQAIIIVPTIELGRQTSIFFKDFLIENPSLTYKFLEDFDFQSPIRSHIIITTPSKLVKLRSESKLIDFTLLKTLVLDEADMLSGKGFFEDIDYIISLIRNPIQFLVFSATYDNNLIHQLKKYVGVVNIISITNSQSNNDISFFAVDTRHRPFEESLINFINSINPYLLLIFAKTTTKVSEIVEILRNNNMDVVSLHGKMSDKERKTSFNRIKENKTRLLVCSDLMARGIDFSDVSDVLSVDIPKDRSFFFHRVGRTARFNKKGNAYLFYEAESIKEVKELEKLGAKFKYVSLSGTSLREKRETPSFLKNKQNDDPELERDIKKAVSKVKSSVVKPNYKKKVKLARAKAVKKHNQKKLKEKIRKERRQTSNE